MNWYQLSSLESMYCTDDVKCDSLMISYDVLDVVGPEGLLELSSGRHVLEFPDVKHLAQVLDASKKNIYKKKLSNKF